MHIQVTGIPFNSAGRTDGVARAAAAIRRAGLLAHLQRAGVTVEDRGDVALEEPTSARDPVSQLIAPDALKAMIAAARAAVEDSLAQGAFPLVLGGDCPILIGCLAAAMTSGQPVGLLFVDGHEDAWPPERSPTGEAADSELGLLLGLNQERLPADLQQSVPIVAFDAVAVLGARDQDELREAGIPSLEGRVAVYRTAAAVATDPEGIVAQSMDRLTAIGSWWLHVDLDVLATERLGAVDYRQPGGLSWEELTVLTAAALRSPGAIGWDITIYNPDLDLDGSAAARIAQYVGDALALR